MDQGWGGSHFFEPPPPPWPKNGTASASRLFAQKKKPPLLTPPSSYERPKSQNLFLVKNCKNALQAPSYYFSGGFVQKSTDFCNFHKFFPKLRDKLGGSYFFFDHHPPLSIYKNTTCLRLPIPASTHWLEDFDRVQTIALKVGSKHLLSDPNFFAN